MGINRRPRTSLSKEEASPGQPDFQSILSSLPFAFLPASAAHDSAAAAAEASLPAPASTLGLRPEDDGALQHRRRGPGEPGRCREAGWERAFHLSLPTVGPPAFAPTAALSQGAGAPIGPLSLAPLSMQGQGLVGEGAPSAVGAASAIASVGASRIGERPPSREPPVGPQRDGGAHCGGRAVLERDIGVRADCSPRQWIVGKPIRRRHPIGGAKSRPRRPEIRSRSVAIGRPDCQFGCPRPYGAERQGRRRSARSNSVRRAVGGPRKRVRRGAVGVSRSGAVVRIL